MSFNKGGLGMIIQHLVYRCRTRWGEKRGKSAHTFSSALLIVSVLITTKCVILFGWFILWSARVTYIFELNTQILCLLNLLNAILKGKKVVFFYYIFVEPIMPYNTILYLFSFFFILIKICWNEAEPKALFSKLKTK